jgi:hypothetical protein
MNAIKFFDNFEGVWKDAVGGGGDLIAFTDGSGWVSTPKKGFIQSDDIQGLISSSQIDWPTWIDYSSSVTITGYSTITNKLIQYMVIGKMMYVQFDFTGTSNATTFSFSLPYSSSSWSGMQIGVHHCIDQTSKQDFCTSVVNASSSTCNLYFQFDITSNQWSGTGTKKAQGVLIIAIS